MEAVRAWATLLRCKRGDDENEPELDDSDLDSSDTRHMLLMLRCRV